MDGHPDFRWFFAPIITTFVIATVYAAVAVVYPKAVPFSNHPHEVQAVIPTPTAQPTAAATASADTTPTGPTVTLVGENLAFDKQTLEASAGQLTIIFDNKDNGVPHNIHVFKGTDATGQSEGSTDVAAGPTTQTLSLNLEPGTYYYHCDVHPTTMFGTLTVK